MININVKYPIAFHKLIKKLIHISEVTDDNVTALICGECKEDFIVVRNHNTPHFRHKSTTKCKGSYETYLHWVTKEVFKEIKEIELPKIFKEDILKYLRVRLDNKVNKLVEDNVPKHFHSKFKAGLKGNLSDSVIVKIDKIETEKDYDTFLGDVRIDIVAKINSEELFIEPFFSSPIIEIKEKKLSLLAIPTLIIDLNSFHNKFGANFKISDLKSYLISKKSKTWLILRVKKVEIYKAQYLEYVTKEIEKKKDSFKKDELIIQEISKLKKNIEVTKEKIKPLRDKILEETNKIIKLKKEIDFKYFDGL